VSLPRPTGAVANDLAGNVLGSTSVQWTWSQGTLIASENDGYAIFSSSDDLFIASATFALRVAYTAEPGAQHHDLGESRRL
jgi:hypothetical protein